MIYNDLIIKEYEVYIWKLKNGEIDFIASKNNELNYIQVTYSLNSNETINREFSALEEISDNYNKYVISLAEEDYSKNGIKHINVIKFLLSDELN